VQRRTGMLGADVPGAEPTDSDLPGIDTTVIGQPAVTRVASRQSGVPPVTEPDVIEWDEALDGRLDDDGTGPPATP
jgi:hypothetical protein